MATIIKFLGQSELVKLDDTQKTALISFLTSIGVDGEDRQNAVKLEVWRKGAKRPNYTGDLVARIVSLKSTTPDELLPGTVIESVEIT